MLQSEEERIATARADVTRRIKALGASGRVKEAISTLAGLAELGIQPDTRAATALVQACCRDMQLAQSIFEEMFGEQIAVTVGQPVPPFLLYSCPPSAQP